MTDGLSWWLTTLAVIGGLTLITAVVSLFFTLGRRPNRMWTDQIGAIDEHGLVRPLAALLNCPLRRGGTIALINNGDAFLDDLISSFEQASRSINFMAYIWEPGRMSDIVFAALIERARAGIQVRILLDGLGGMRCPDEDIDRLRAVGGIVATFRPPKLGTLTRFHRRNHRRAIVVDGTVAWTGGMAVGDKWLGDARNEEEWRDTMVRLEGALAHNMQSAFAELWAFCTGEVLTGDSFFPDPPASDMDSGILSTSVISSPSSEEHPLRLFFFLSFLAARERLYITSPYFVPDKHTREVVKRRARAGVDVRILMPNDLTDAAPIRRASHSYYSELLNAGVRIYEFQPTMIHTKHVVCDGRWSVVGSANMDIRSKELNEENVLGILDADFGTIMEQTFLDDLERAHEIDRVEWQKRGLGHRIIERIAVLFAEQY